MRKRITYLLTTALLVTSLLSPMTVFAEDVVETEQENVSESTKQEEVSENNEQKVTSDTAKEETSYSKNKQNEAKNETTEKTTDEKVKTKSVQQKDVKAGYIADIEFATVTLSQNSFYYDGTAKRPSVTVTYSGRTLVQNRDYRLNYYNNTKAGEAYVEVEGIGDCWGSQEVYYYIYYNVNDMIVTLNRSKYVYDGQPKEPKASVKLRSTNEDITSKCEISGYSGNKNAGTAYVKLSSKNYERNDDSWYDETGVYFQGTVKQPFTISPKQAKSKELSIYANNEHYNGKQKTLKIWSPDKNGYLSGNKDYTLKYLTNCKKVGKHKIKIVFKGNYTGTIVKSFKIYPPAPKVKIKSKKGKTVTVTWKKVKNATGYKIYKDGKIYKTKKNSIKLKGEKDRSWMTFWVDSYKNKLGSSYNSKTHTIVFAQPVTAISLSKTNWGEITLKISNYSTQYYHNYQFQISNNKKFRSDGYNYTKTVRGSYSSVRWYNIPSGEKRYFRVRQYWYTSSGKLKVGKWSKVKAATAY